MVALDAAAGDPTRPWAAVATLAVGAPAMLAYNLPPSATFFNQAAALFGWGLLLAMVARVLPARVALGGSGPAALLGALALLAGAALASSVLYGLPWSLALQAIGLVGATALAVLIGAAVVRAGFGTQAFHAFCLGLLTAGLVTTLIGIVQVYVPQWADGNWIAQSAIASRAVGNLRQPNHVSSLLMWSTIAVVWLGEAGRLGRKTTALLGAALLFGVVLSGSRTGGLGVVMLALWGALDRRLSGRSRLLLVITPVVFAALWFGVTEWGHHTERAFGGEAQLNKADISSSRFGIWSNTVALIAEHPWAGVGWGEFNLAWSMTPFPDRPVAFFDHTHNLLLQLAVELGLPLAALVLALLGWALWRAWADAHRADPAADSAQSSMPRAAFAMVLMILIHSQLEYPLWYSYFLLPAAFAFGLCLGGPLAPRAPSGRAPGQTRPLMVAAMALMLAALVATMDYMTVVAIFAPPPNAAPLAQRIAAGQRSALFSFHGDYAAVTTAEHPSQAMRGFDGAVHYLLDTRLMTAWATALEEAGDTDRARYVAQRMKEFRNPLAEPFLEPCRHAAPEGQSLPFQCLEPTVPLTYRDLLTPRR
jgi:O-antigen ligase